MAKTGKSLHQVVGSWLAPTAAEKLCVTRLKSRNSLRERYVFVEAYKDTGPVGLYFFYHKDGGWRVFPPTLERPTMRCIYLSRDPVLSR
ncbi:hypothetical protein FHX59_006505 [Paraburkholderia silvatlantica]|uniref:Uncharacterized protein n=1 Tax=Paraburkholderia silvatlantica TaxID=321895 RepID=A0ABR6FX76_9BURK|nr:hypothetical protein [Paraburkholderia silvatlantica]PVY24705.1 hypothetical protein C7411_12794 [Paraburkholderia silvatlantica]PXW31201.1 hypothetical protein C7413_12694 [Paraburkholderia silvatlantica]